MRKKILALIAEAEANGMSREEIAIELMAFSLSVRVPGLPFHLVRASAADAWRRLYAEVSDPHPTRQ